jgi:Bacterial CdiA-CT RNAse A domain
VRDHVGKIEAELFKELDNDWKRWDSGRLQITKYRPAEGSFTSAMEATDFVNQTLRDNREDVDAVATGKKDWAMLEKRFGYVTGYEAYRADPDSDSYIRNTYGVRIIIDHDPRSERGYTVRMAFPTNHYVKRR